ncbi:MAG: hypothetical protein WC679_11710 [Bacteroidales bacterium]|jgi:hypothetical protein
MKQFILIFQTILISSIVFGQNTNPYKVFGCNTNANYEIPISCLFRVNNSDSKSNIKALAIDFDKSLTYLLGENDSIIKTLNIDPEEVLIWLSTDPKSDKYPSLSPYHYCSNNPIMRVDPNGMSDDWVQDIKTSQYQWKDNVTSSANTPNGYRYVGSEGDDIIRDLNIPTTFDYKRSGGIGAGLVDGGVVNGTSTNLSAGLSVDANISFDQNNTSKNNKLGKTFNGVTFTGYMNQKSLATNSDLELNYSGYLEIGYGNNGRYKSTFSPSQSYIVEQGYNPSEASITIPANQMNKGKTFHDAFIRVGATNNQAINTRKEFRWSLQKVPVYLQGR